MTLTAHWDLGRDFRRSLTLGSLQGQGNMIGVEEAQGHGLGVGGVVGIQFALCPQALHNFFKVGVVGKHT